MTDDGSLIVKDLQSKIQRCLQMQRSRIDRRHADAKKQLREDFKQLDILTNKMMRAK